MVSSADMTSSFCHTISQTSVDVAFHARVRLELAVSTELFNSLCTWNGEKSRDMSQFAYLIFFSVGGGAAQVPYGNAPVIPTGLEGKTISGPFSIYHLIKICKLNFSPQSQFQGPQNAV